MWSQSSCLLLTPATSQSSCLVFKLAISQHLLLKPAIPRSSCLLLKPAIPKSRCLLLRAGEGEGDGCYCVDFCISMCVHACMCVRANKYVYMSVCLYNYVHTFVRACPSTLLSVSLCGLTHKQLKLQRPFSPSYN